jgi:hypothetical protein
MAESVKNAQLKNLPCPFPSFGPQDSNEQEQVPFPPSPAITEEKREGGDLNPRSSEEPSSFSGRRSNSFSSLGRAIPSRYPFAFRRPAHHEWAMSLRRMAAAGTQEVLYNDYHVTKGRGIIDLRIQRAACAR